MTETIYCAGPHVDPVPLYAFTRPAGVTIPAPHRVLCADCAAVYARAINEPETLPGPPDADGEPTALPNPDWRPPGALPTLELVTRMKRRRVPDWAPTRDNYGPPAGGKSR